MDEDKLKEEYRERFGTETFCDNCNYVLSEEQQQMFHWWISKIKELKDEELKKYGYK